VSKQAWLTILAILAAASSAHAQDQPQMVRDGAKAYRLCAACHSLQSGVNLSGPSLANVWGRKVASLTDFKRYTEVLKQQDFVWDEISLNGWIADPQAMVAGTTMTFRGVADDRTRADLIAFLRIALGPEGAEKVVAQGLIPKSMAEGQMPQDVSALPADRRVTKMRHCGDAYFITTADGHERPFWEANVRIKTDSSARGPKKDAPALLNSGMVGDRVSVVFSTLADVSRLVAEDCAADKQNDK
jgi:cytochrome c